MDTYVQWLLDVLQSLRDLMISKVMMILWSIWREGNEWLWIRISRPNNSVVFQGLECLYEWLQAKNQASVSWVPWVVHECSKWHSPSPSFVKCNCDVVIFSDRGEIGLGIVLRDESGVFLAYKMLKLPGLPAVKEYEALAHLKAMSWVRTLGYNQLFFETDSQMVVINALAYGSGNISDLGVLTGSCHLLLCSELGFKVVFVWRHANGIAHALTR